MNKQNHQLVFNAARGCIMVVSEAAQRQGKRPGCIAGQRVARSVALAWALTGLGAALVQAQIIADPTAPGQQRPTVLGTPNGAPLVDIQTPSAAGVSRNTYQQFDVGAPGAVLNNSRTNAQSQLGGWVQGNPWLATGEARIILNEVNSQNPSFLNGFIELAGRRAEVIIANPSGIQVNGAGFINASRATLTTGTPVVNGGN
jgi:filamentous hemagglutinin